MGWKEEWSERIWEIEAVTDVGRDPGRAEISDENLWLRFQQTWERSQWKWCLLILLGRSGRVSPIKAFQINSIPDIDN